MSSLVSATAVSVVDITIPLLRQATFNAMDTVHSRNTARLHQPATGRMEKAYYVFCYVDAKKRACIAASPSFVWCGTRSRPRDLLITSQQASPGHPNIRKPRHRTKCLRLILRCSISTVKGASRQVERPPKRPPTDCSHVHAPLEALKIVERVKGIEPSLSAWEAGVMPLYDTRSERLTLYQMWLWI